MTYAFELGIKLAGMTEPEPPKVPEAKAPEYQAARPRRTGTMLDIKSEVDRATNEQPNYRMIQPTESVVGKRVVEGVKNSSVRQAFKVGFCKRMVELGVDPEQFEVMMYKRAGGLADAVKTMVGGAGNIAGGVGKLGLIGIPAVSALAGWGLGSQDNVTGDDVKDLERLSTIHEYENAIKRMHRMDAKPGQRKQRTAVEQPVAGQSTQSVMQEEMPKAAAVQPIKPIQPIQPIKPLPSTTMQPIGQPAQVAQPAQPAQPAQASVQAQGNVRDNVEQAKAKLNRR